MIPSAPYLINHASRLLTPALAIYPEIVDQNIATTIRLLSGDPNRWRPHVKTAKLQFIIIDWCNTGSVRPSVPPRSSLQPLAQLG